LDRVIKLINPMLRGWVAYFAVGNSSECFAFVKDWVEKKIRRHMARARNRNGFGWKRWSTQWLYESLRGAELGLYFAPQHRLEPLLDQLAPGPLDSGDAGVQRRGNPAVVQPSPNSDTSAFSRMRAFVSSWAERLPLRINSSSWARSSTLNRTTYFLTAISFPTTNHLHRCLAATEIQKLPSFSMTGATS
jgi:hypothetical protein